MDKTQFAKLLHGREYPFALTTDEIITARANGLVVVYGASDDLMVLAGALYDEVDCYGGGAILIDRLGPVPDFEIAVDEAKDENEMREWFKRKDSAKSVAVIWDEGDYSWQYGTDIPHATFDVMEDGEKYCKGIVIEVDEI